MITIWKFAIATDPSEQFIAMPRGASALTVKVERSQLHLYMLVDTCEHVERRRVRVVVTDTPRGEGLSIESYVATALLDGFMWHVFVGLVGVP